MCPTKCGKLQNFPVFVREKPSCPPMGHELQDVLVPNPSIMTRAWGRGFHPQACGGSNCNFAHPLSAERRCSIVPAEGHHGA